MRTTPVQAAAGEPPSHGLMLRRFGWTSVLAFGVQVAGVGLTYLAHLLAARLAGPESYGLYAYILAIVVVVAYFAALGYDSALLRFLPLYAERRAWPLAAGLIAFVERRVVLAALVWALVGLAVIALLAARHPPAEWLWSALLGLPLVLVWALMLIRSATMRALGNVVMALVPERVVRDGAFLLLLLGAMRLNPAGVDAATLMALMLAGTLCAVALATRGARALSPAGAERASGEEAAWRRAAYPFLALVIAEALINRCGVLLLGGYGRIAEAGCFALVSNLAALAMLPRLAVNAFLTPMIARLHARRELAALEMILARGAVWSLAGSCLIGAAVWLASPRLLAWYGPSFLAGRDALAVLIVGQVIATSAGAQLQLLKMTGSEVAAVTVLIGSLAVHVAVGLVLVPRMPLEGAALANLACQVTWNLAMIPIIWRRLGIRPGILRGLAPTAR